MYKYHLFIDLYDLFNQGFLYIAMYWHMSAILVFIRELQVIQYIRNLRENVGNNMCYHASVKVRRIQEKYFTQTLLSPCSNLVRTSTHEVV